jgi:ParB/RepB/Spo0J family partition protein
MTETRTRRRETPAARPAAAAAGDTHWQRPGSEGVAACTGREGRAPLTADREQVTCARCKGTRAWIRPADQAAADSGGITFPAELPLTALAPHPANPRDDLGDLAELAASIAQIGVLEPLVVATAAAHGAGGWPAVAGECTHVILAGHRRHAAAAQAGLASVPCVVRDDLAGAEALVVMLSENDPGKRRGLEPLAEARAFQALADRGWSQRQIAGRVGCAQGQVSKRLALLRLPEPVMDAMARGKVSAAAGAELARLAEHPEVAVTAMHQIGPGGWSSPAEVVSRHLRDIERQQRQAELTAEMQAAGIKVAEYSRLGRDSSDRRLPEDADPEAHRAAGCLVAVVQFGQREYYCTDPDRHEGTPDALPGWGRRHGADVRAADAARLADERERKEAARVRKIRAGQLAAQPVSAARAAELLAPAVIGRHGDSGSLRTAVQWLRLCDIGPETADPHKYAAAVEASGDAADIRRLAVAVAMAADETLTATTGAGTAGGTKWAARQVAYLGRLIAEAGYRPGEWEAAQLAEAEARVTARLALSCAACGCRHSATCGKYAYDRQASRYLSCDAQPDGGGGWTYYCNCQRAAERDEAGSRDDLFDAIEALVFLTSTASPVAEETADDLAAAIAQPAEVLAEAFAAQDGNGDVTALLEAVRAVHGNALPYQAGWPARLAEAFAELEAQDVIGQSQHT